MIEQGGSCSENHVIDAKWYKAGKELGDSYLLLSTAPDFLVLQIFRSSPEFQESSFGNHVVPQYREDSEPFSMIQWMGYSFLLIVRNEPVTTRANKS